MTTALLVPAAGVMADTALGPMPALAVPGHSGCRLTIGPGPSGWEVCKTSASSAYNARLARQAAKQAAFAAHPVVRGVVAPAVLSCETGRDGLLRLRMPYLPYHASTAYFRQASRPAVDAVVERLFALIDAEIAASPMAALPPDLVPHKLDGIDAALMLRPDWPALRVHSRRLRRAFESLGGLRLPLGVCHGDLTFSNVLISADGTRVALIDFLDGFLEAPITDLAKLRQDTRFAWTLQMEPRDDGHVRFLQVMRYVDRAIAQAYGHYTWYADAIEPMIGLTLLRIAPYANDARVRAYLLRCLGELELE